MLRLLFFILWLIGNVAYGQGTWTSKDGATGGQSILDIEFRDDLNGVLVGSSGKISTTTDGGKTWTARSSGTTQQLNAVIYAGTQIYAVGLNGTIRKSADDGITWANVTCPVATANLWFSDVTYNASNNAVLITGFYIGAGVNAVLLRAPSGAAFSSLTYPAGSVPKGITAVGGSIYMITDGAEVLKSTNNGTAWTSLYYAGITGLDKIFALDANTVWVGGWSGGAAGAELFRSTDGGATWAGMSDWEMNKPFYFLSNTVGFGAGLTADINKTSNGGATWATSYATATAVNCINFRNIGWGVAGRANGTVALYNDPADINVRQGGTNLLDGAGTYDFGSYGVGFGSSAVSFTVQNLGGVPLDISSFSISGADALDFTTTNFGTTTVAGGLNTSFTIKFKPSSTGAKIATVTIVNNSPGEVNYTFTLTGTGVNSEITPVYTSTNPLNEIYFLTANPTLGWVAGDGGRILRTTNGGATWTNATSGTSNLNGVFFSNSTAGWLVGDGGVIKKSTNGGSTWVNQTNPVTDIMNAVFVPDATTGWTVGNNKRNVKTATGGTTWTNTNVGGGHWLDIYGLSPNLAYIVGASGAIWKTTNGTTWAAQTSGTTQQLNSVYFTDPNTGFVVGNAGVIRKTTNGGTTWTAITSGTTQNLLVVHFSDPNNGFAGGANGTLLKTTDGGTTWTAINTAMGTSSITSLKINNSELWLTTDQGNIAKYSASPNMNLRQNLTNIAQNTSYNLGQTQVGNSLNSTFTIENLSGADLTLSSFQLNGANAAEFSTVSWLSSNLIVGNNTSFQVNFSPVSLGSKTAFITIANNDPNKNPYYFTVFATASTSISGQITELGINISNATITLSTGFTTVTNANGFYTAFISSSFTGTITPSKVAYTFLPNTISLTGITTPQSNQNFSATTNYSISGTFKEAGLRPITETGSNFAASNGNNASAAGTGFYTVFVTSGFSGTLTPSMPNFPQITPNILAFSNILSAQSNQNFSAFRVRQITGTILEGGVGLDLANISLSNGFSTVSDPNGFYTAFVSSSASPLTLTPSKTGFAFLPLSHTLSMITADHTNLNFSAIQAYSISGKITESGTNLAGATITLDNGFTTISDSNGEYVIFVSSGFTGTATASKAGYTITPNLLNYNNLTASQTNQNFSGLTVHRLEGTISEPVFGGLNGVNLAFSNGFTTVSDSNGFYTAFLSSGFTGTITPNLANYFFTPNPLTINNLVNYLPNQNFSGSRLYTITGTMLENGVAVNSASLSLSNSFTTASDSNGFYTAFVSSGFTGTITPSRTNYFFTPNNLNLTNIVSNQNNQNFSAQTLYAVQGVLNEAGNPLSGATLSLSNSFTTLTNANGFYTAFVSTNFSGTISPSKPTFSFTPTVLNLANVMNTQSNQNFSGSSFYTISGNITEGGNSLSNVSILLTNGFSTVSDSNGNYQAFVTSGFSGTLTFSLPNYFFAPNPLTFNNITSHQFNQSAIAETLYQVRGTVLKNNMGLNNVAITLSNGFSTSSNANGFYTAFVSSGFNGTITPNLAAHVFISASRNLADVMSLQTDQDFEGVSAYAISGRVFANNLPLPNADLLLSNGFSTVSDPNGFYTVYVAVGSSGTLSVSKYSYFFQTHQINFANITADLPNQHFFGAALVEISGRLSEFGVGLANNPVFLDNGFTTVSDADGVYSFFVSSGFSGRLNTSKTNYSFEPPFIDFASITTAQIDQNFIGRDVCKSNTPLVAMVTAYSNKNCSGVKFSAVIQLSNPNPQTTYSIDWNNDQRFDVFYLVPRGNLLVFEVENRTRFSKIWVRNDQFPNCPLGVIELNKTWTDTPIESPDVTNIKIEKAPNNCENSNGIIQIELKNLEKGEFLDVDLDGDGIFEFITVRKKKENNNSKFLIDSIRGGTVLNKVGVRFSDERGCPTYFTFKKPLEMPFRTVTNLDIPIKIAHNFVDFGNTTQVTLENTEVGIEYRLLFATGSERYASEFVSATGDKLIINTPPIYEPSMPFQVLARNNRGCTAILTNFVSVTTIPYIFAEELDILRIIFESTDGNNWTKPWVFTKPYQHEGVKYEKGHIIEIDISKQKAKDKLPYLSIFKLPKLKVLNVENNKMTFIHLEKLLGKGIEFSYKGQDKVNDKLKLITAEGATVSLSMEIGGTDLSYQWYKDGLKIEGANSAILVLTTVTPAQTGTYLCAASSPILPDLVIQRNDIGLTVLPKFQAIDLSKLKRFYDDLKGYNWLKKWNFDDPNLANWHGITYDNGKIVSVNLLNNQMDGVLADVIFEEKGFFAQIENLNLSGNTIKGRLPTSLKNLQNLKRLDLSDCRFENDIWEILTEMPNLEVLVLNNMNLSEIPESIGKLKNLKVLLLEKNQIKEISALVGKLENLEILDLAQNQLETLPPHFFDKLKNLQRLDLHKNQLKVLPQFLGLELLIELNLSNNQIGDLPEDLQRNTNLEFLDLSNNRLDFADLEKIMPKKGGRTEDNLRIFYTPQAFLGSPEHLILGQGSAYMLKSYTLASKNAYTWFQNSSPVRQIHSPSNGDYLMSSLSKADAGSYRVAITNPVAPDLTLYTHEVKIAITCAVQTSARLELTGNAQFCEGEKTDKMLKINNLAEGSTVVWFRNGLRIPHETNLRMNTQEAGVYTVLITDKEGCAGFLPQAIRLEQMPAPKPEIGTDETDPTLLKVENAKNYATFQWFRNDQLIPNAIIPDWRALDYGYYQVKVVDHNGCIGISNRFMITPLANEQDFDNQSITIYPNPANDILQIEMPNKFARNCEVSLWNAQGQEVRKGKFENTIYVGNLPSGLYLVKISLEGKEVWRKVQIGR